MTVSLGYVILYVSDVPAAIDFYRTAFGMEERFITPDKDYGELATGATTLAFVANELAETNLGAAGGFTALDASPSPVGVTVVLVTEDVPAAVDAAVEAGARLYVEPTEKPWGQTVGYVIDPFGALVELATPIAAG